MKFISLRALLFALFLLVLPAFSSCASNEAKLTRTAVDFYNALYQLDRKASIAQFFLPAVRKQIQKNEGSQYLKFLEEGMASAKNKPREPITPKDVRVRISGKFGVTWAETRQDNPLSQASPMKWVKVGGRWFLFQGPKDVLEKLGVFPLELLPEQNEKS
jgi:hypothetical protein